MKKSVLLTIACVLAVSLTQAQHAHCGFDEHLEKMLAEDPSGMQTILEHNARTEEIKRARLNGEAERGGGPRIIPTVFHVIHNGGSENISYEQIEDQIRSLNEDYRRLNADTVNTRTEFLDVAADANVEFRLAKLDPNGDCTDGVVRIMSPLTDNASDDSGVKGVSYWPSNKIISMFGSLATIDSEGEQGIVLVMLNFLALEMLKQMVLLLEQTELEVLAHRLSMAVTVER
ncbi:MAG: hypothetical protein H6603_01615 [Flavobacteriales bacterium]|nr:hypothetical protein [Flavobacteriales bacterium]